MRGKRILIVAYYYFPCNNIASHRPVSWAKELKKSGFEPVVITRHWTGEERNWNEFASSNKGAMRNFYVDGIRIIYLPYKKYFFQKLFELPILRDFAVYRFVVSILAGLFGCFELDRDVNKNFYTYINSLLTAEKFDIIITTSGPVNCNKLAYKIKKGHKILWLADFRDLWDMNMLKSEKRTISAKDKIKYICHRLYIKKWIHQADVFLVCSEGFVDPLKSICPDKEIVIIKNGFERDLFKEIDESPSDKFTILCLGTLYKEQEKKIFAEGVRLFCQGKDMATIQLKFLGVEVNEAVTNEILTLFNREFLVTSPFVSRTEALREIKKCQILYYPVWKGYRGVYPGKIFEYLGAERNILITPGDGFMLDSLLETTQTGKYANTPEEVAIYLTEWYLQWRDTGHVVYKGRKEIIELYTREKQAEVLSDYLLGAGNSSSNK